MQDLINEAKMKDSGSSNLAKSMYSKSSNQKLGQSLRGINNYSQRSSVMTSGVGGHGSIAFLSEREGSIMEGRDSIHLGISPGNAELDIQQATRNRDSRRSSLTVLMQNRLTDNVHLSALTNQIMELILDNIRLVHMNAKLLGYSRDQADELSQLEQQQEHLSK